ALAIQQQPAHIDGAPMPSLATTNRFQQIDQKSLQTFMALSDLGLGHVRDYHGLKHVSILNVVITVTAALQGGPVDRFENRVNLLVFQVIDGPLSRALKGNAQDALGQLQMLRITRRHKMKKRVDSGEADISRGDAILKLRSCSTWDRSVI